MDGILRAFSLKSGCTLLITLLGLVGCSASTPPKPAATATASAPAAPARLVMPKVEVASEPVSTPSQPYPVMLGIDVLEARGFDVLKGKRVGLLTHPAGVNRQGVSTIDVLRRSSAFKLVALYGPEHGVYGDYAAEVTMGNTVDKRTGLPMWAVYSMPNRRPTKTSLKGIDVMVIDLQDIGTRSYTFVSAMKRMVEGCFENNVEVVVLDRPNPLGGLKADGPPLDPQWTGYVGAFRVPYVHGLTIGELARMSKEAPGVLEVPEKTRLAGKLTIIPMRGWKRSMRWPETGLTWVPTSQYVQDFNAVQGYPMVGLGCYWDPKSKFDIGFRHGVGRSYAFRGLSYKNPKLVDQMEKELRALKLPGLQFRRVSAPDEQGKPAQGLFIEISDWDDWRPTELNFYLMKLACKFEGKNPFLTGDASGFLRHLGSQAFYDAIRKEGANINIDAWIRDWQGRTKAYQQQVRKYWMYN